MFVVVMGKYTDAKTVGPRGGPGKARKKPEKPRAMIVFKKKFPLRGALRPSKNKKGADGREVLDPVKNHDFSSKIEWKR